NTYVWDSRNRLSALSGAAGPATFAYDALGRRFRKTVDGAETRFTYDGLNPIQLVSNRGAVTNLLAGLGIDEFLFLTEDVNQRVLLSDAIGSTVRELDALTEVRAEYVYEPFGRVSVLGAALTPFQYTGRESDATGLYYYRSRYYDPTLQRFLSEDRYH